MRRLLYIVSFSVGLTIAFTGFQANGQSTANTSAAATSDSLSLAQVMQTVIQSHPSVKESEEAIAIADAKIGLAKSAYLPNVDASASYTRLGPVPSLDVPALGGKFQLYPADNYVAAINYNQSIYDFGKTKQSVGVERESKILAEKNVELVKQGLSQKTATAFYTIAYLQEAIKIKDQEIQALKDHLEFVEKQKTTGSATQNDFLKVKVRLSAAESQKIDLETTKKMKVYVLKSLMNYPLDAPLKIKIDALDLQLSLTQDSLFSYAFSHRMELDIAKEKEKVAQLQYNLTKAQDNPALNVFASGGGKNGYIPDLNEVKPNFSAGIALKVPLFNGNRTKNNLLIAQSAINNSQLDSELAKRNITTEVIESETARESAAQKIEQGQVQVSQAEEAFALAKVKFASGSITNLDLLDAENDLSNSRLMLLKSKVDYAVSVFNLNISLGNKMY